MYSNSKFKLGSAVATDPADYPILIAGDRGNIGAGDGPARKVPSTGGPNPAEIMAGSRSGLGRLQKAGLGSSVHDTVANSRPVAKPTTAGGYDGSGINPKANRPGRQDRLSMAEIKSSGMRAPRGRKGFLR